ncbi:hypothetical protein MJ634_003830 [Providencia rettgeri]|uniref:hypothetical protein n=1 Tax=Providencia rettgeri TaxID=587 RepID=UPI001B358C1E|nr:hypothetical protein [Providencia rettgeri]MBQ0607208.1 hypothetical protein [Providencia rettgeri]MCJ2222188.1 hypothetical protein [Providencia rettgeri]MDY0819998.1 hypothetical protein [Providencia rettgeri]
MSTANSENNTEDQLNLSNVLPFKNQANLRGLESLQGGLPKLSPLNLVNGEGFQSGIGGANINQSNLIGDNNMSIPREELDAKLAQNKAEVQAIASGMREEMAAWRETQNAQMVQMNATLTSMSAKMDAKFETLDAKIDAVDKSLGGRIDGLNMAVSGIQSGISIKLTIFGVIMAALIAIAGWWFSSNQPTTSQQPQPTIIYVQQPNVAEPPQPTNNSK